MKRWIAPLFLLLALGGTAAAYNASQDPVTGAAETPCCPECDDCDHCPFR